MARRSPRGCDDHRGFPRLRLLTTRAGSRMGYAILSPLTRPMALVLSMAAVVVVHVVACMVIHPPTLSAESSDHHTMDHLPKAVLGVSDSILALGALARCSCLAQAT